MTSYDALQEHLRSSPDHELTMSFAELEELVGPLPPSARQPGAWWINDPERNTRASTWLAAGRRVVRVDYLTGTVSFSEASGPIAPRASGATRAAVVRGPATGPPVGLPVWDRVWEQVAEQLRQHTTAGLRHLLTEDVVRFATIRALVAEGVAASRLAVEHRIPMDRYTASIDLVVDRPPTAVVELKYPRDPAGQGAADTMTFGEVLRDLYRLAWLDMREAWAVQVYEPRLRRYLSRRSELRWTWKPGDTLELPVGLPQRLPATARGSLPSWSTKLAVAAHCTAAHEAGELIVAVYRVRPLR